MPLSTYRKKRDFARTDEPRGKAHRRSGFSFVVQKHAARSLHYDFRLELDGVLLSWAVPKGPSLDPRVKRLAVQTEDHPIEYGKFEGVIPKGEYGAGAVEIWDRGSWKPEGDPRKAYRDGRLSFDLDGGKLHGGWHLIRTRSNGEQRSWLLMKSKDAYARGGSGSAIVDEAIPATPALEGTPRKAFPKSIAPELATLVEQAPEGDDWLHELKLDGYRMLVRCERGRSQFFTRRGHDWSERLPGLVSELGASGLEQAFFDGELVVLAENGVSDFQRLQNSLSAGRDQDCVYYVFDLLHFDGRDLRELPLLQRKRLLAAAFERMPASARRHLRVSEHVVGNGPAFFARACELGAEGIVCKRADSHYVSARTRAWLKVKCRARQEFVIGGYTEPRGAGRSVGALLLGVREAGELKYAGKVGTGFSQQSLRELEQKFQPLERATPAFAPAPRGPEARDVHWLEPELVAEIEFSERTRDGRVRHAAFRGLREDKRAREVHAERTAPTPDKSAARASQPQALAPALRSVRLTHPTRVLYADAGITKADLALYYARVATRMLPHLARRPLMLVRCPEGQGGECFHQKHPLRATPSAIRRVKIREQKGTFESIYVEDAEGLLALVQIGALEIHSWGSRIDRLEYPDQLIFDLDPDAGLPWARTIEAARELERELDLLALPSFLKTTGGKGLHVCVPIEPTLEWERVKQFSRAIAERLAHKHPDRYLTAISKAKRKGKVLIDYLRNSRGATAVCAFSTRARPAAPVSVPIAWDELVPELRPDHFELKNLPQRLAELERDPWRDFESQRSPLERAFERVTAR